MLSVQQLNLSFGNKKVLENLSATFPSGKIHGIAGLNGSGKTTLFNVLAQRIPADNGSITFHQKEFHYSLVSFLETSSFFYSLLTGKEYLSIFSGDQSLMNEQEMADLFQLPINHLIDTYSTGMRKKLAILAVLKQNRPVVLLDEPFNGLDLESNKILELLLLRLAEKGKTILISSHILQPMKDICEQIFLLQNGNINTLIPKDQFQAFEKDFFSDLETRSTQIIHNNL
jgi:ABC-2 type transport system ATP-binding protein